MGAPETSPTSTKTDDNITLTRTFDAPLKRVFDAWTNEEAFKQWWGPKQFTCPVAKIDARKGGEVFAAMRGPDGKDIYSKDTYLELVPNERIVLRDHFADEKGNVVQPSHYGMNNWPDETTISLTFSEENGKTKLGVRHSGIASAPAKDRDDCRKGWSETLDKLAGYVERTSH
jgi:uncharacterized protein YndB with AHSA1/START domain